jgi:dTDP-4-dehydrorhamnose reductase
MLGHKLFQILREEFPGTLGGVRRSIKGRALAAIPLFEGDDVLPGLDAEKFDTIRLGLEAFRPDFTINCVGVIKQRDAAADPVTSITVNALFPHQLAEATATWGGRVIHFSTDCVFSGRKGNYTEEDPSDALDLYGKTKALGEVSYPNALTLRTSIIGRELDQHRSLVDWFLAQNGGRVRGFRRAIFSGVTTIEMAKVVARVIRQRPGLSGVFQVSSDPISKYDLLHLIRQAYGLDISIEADDQETCDRSMCGRKFTEATGWVAPQWPEMVRELAADPTPYNSWLVEDQNASSRWSAARQITQSGQTE